MVVIPIAVALGYIVISIRAILGFRFAILTSFLITLAVAAITTVGVERFIANGFSYTEGHWLQSKRTAGYLVELVLADGSVIRVDNNDVEIPVRPPEKSMDIRPYAFLLASILAVAVVLLHLLGWYLQYRRALIGYGW